MSVNDIFTCLESSANENIAREAQYKNREIQKYIILDEIPHLLVSLAEWLEQPEVTSHFVRFAAHLVLFFEQIGQAYPKDVDKIVEL